MTVKKTAEEIFMEIMDMKFENKETDAVSLLVQALKDGTVVSTDEEFDDDDYDNDLSNILEVALNKLITDTDAKERWQAELNNHLMKKQTSKETMDKLSQQEKEHHLRMRLIEDKHAKDKTAATRRLATKLADRMQARRGAKVNVGPAPPSKPVDVENFTILPKLPPETVMGGKKRRRKKRKSKKRKTKRKSHKRTKKRKSKKRKSKSRRRKRIKSRKRR